MAPRYGRLYATAVLRPLAEQLVDALDVQRGDTVCDVMCDAGVLGVAVGVAVGTQGRVVLVDTDAELLHTTKREVLATGCAVSTAIAEGDTVIAPDLPHDRAGSLCTLGFWEGAAPFDAVERMIRPSGRAALVTWDVHDPPLHEVALAGALRDVLGMRSAFLTRCLASPEPPSGARWNATTVHDVVRFDGIGHYWAAMVEERPISNEIDSEVGLIASLRAECARALRSCTAADETIRIPVRATLWSHTAPGRV